MEVSQYYITTLANAGGKLGPLLAFVIVGYFIFFKLPFLLLLRNVKKGKEALKEQVPTQDVAKSDSYSVKDYEKFVQRKKRLEAEQSEPKAKSDEPLRISQGAGKGESQRELSPETLFELRPGQAIKKDDLRKKYHELLRQNHPDKVAALSPEFRTLADRKTKQINDAYAKLLKRAV